MQPWYGTARLPKQNTSRSNRHHAVAHDGDINILQLVQDAHYYMGFTQLAHYTIFLAMGIVLLLFHVSALNSTASTAYFRTSTTAQLASAFDPDNAAAQHWRNVHSFYDAAVYYRTFLRGSIDASTKLGLGAGFVRLGEYANVTYARVVVNFLENCRVRGGNGGPTQEGIGPRCITSASPRIQDMFHLRQPARDPYATWHTAPASDFKFRSAAPSTTPWSSLAVVANVSSSQRADYLAKLGVHLSDGHLAVLGLYAYSIGLDIIASNTLAADDYAVFSLRVQRSSGGSGVDVKAFQKLSTTTPGKRSLYLTPKDRLRTALEVAFWLAFFWMVALDYAQWLLARRQGCSLGEFLRTPWNLYCWLANLALLSWLVSYLVLLVRWSHQHAASHWPSAPASTEDFYRYEHYPALYATWVYWGAAMVLLLGVRMLRFTRLHSGLNVFHDVLRKTMRDLADFFVVFAFVIVILGTCAFCVFQVSGGNSKWLSWSDGASVLGRLAFNTATYEDVYNDGIGAGRYGWVITAIFWLSIASLLVWSGNIFLSAVSYAYGSVRDKNPQVEVFFLWEVLLRVFSFFAYLYWMTLGAYLHRRRHPPGDPPTPLTLTQHFNILYDASSENAHAFPSSAPISLSPTTSVSAPAPALPSRLPSYRGSAFEVVWHSGEGLLQPEASADPPPPPPPLGLLQPSGNSANSLRKELMRSHSESSAAVNALFDRDDGRQAEGRRRSLSQAKERLRLSGTRKGRHCWEGFSTWLNLTDIHFYEAFLVDSPREHPRWYMLSRWAVASRPEMRALAVYFTDFRTCRLAKSPPPPTFNTPLDPRVSVTSVESSPPSGSHSLHSLLRHPMARGERLQEEWIKGGVPEYVSRAQLLELLEEVQRAHPATLACARMWFIPMAAAKYLLGHFWRDCVHATIRTAIKRVYNPRFMKEIESSFAIDEDEEGAIPTLRDLQSRVQDPMHALTHRAASLEARLRKMEGMLISLLQRDRNSQHQVHAPPPPRSPAAAAPAAPEAEPRIATDLV